MSRREVRNRLSDRYWGDLKMSRRNIGILVILLVVGVWSESSAEYLIYLKGGHYIAADNCTFSSRRERAQEADPEKEDSAIVQVEDCTKGKPEGQIFWSTIDGKFGEVNADEVYYIYGSKELVSIAPHRQAKPLEDYLIVNRGDSFINAKVVSESEGRVYGVMRDDLANINRRAVTEIVPAADAKSRSGEGLCPGQRAEFDVTDARVTLNRFVGIFRNLSRDACVDVHFEVEVTDRGNPLGKFEVKESTAVPPGGSARFDAPIPGRFLKHIERFKDREGGIQLCYAKVQSFSQCQAEIREQRR